MLDLEYSGCGQFCAERDRLGDFHMMYDLSKRIVLDLFRLEPGRLRGGGVSLDETQALNLIQGRMPTYLAALHDKVDEEGKPMVLCCATLMVRHTALVVHILVEAYRDAQIDFLRSVVHEQAVS